MTGNLVTLLCGDERMNSGLNSSALNDTLGLGNSTAPVTGSGYVGDPMLYILVVLLFYAGSITFFMVKYIRKQNEEREFDNDYNTYVMRVGFDEKLMEAKNKTAVRLKEVEAGNLKKTPAELQEVLVTSSV